MQRAERHWEPVVVAALAESRKGSGMSRLFIQESSAYVHPSGSQSAYSKPSPFSQKYKKTIKSSHQKHGAPIDKHRDIENRKIKESLPRRTNHLKDHNGAGGYGGVTL